MKRENYTPQDPVDDSEDWTYDDLQTEEMYDDEDSYDDEDPLGALEDLIDARLAELRAAAGESVDGYPQSSGYTPFGNGNWWDGDFDAWGDYCDCGGDGDGD